MLLLLLFGFLFATFRELSEHAKENGFKGFPDWWSTAKSWKNKHEWGERLNLPPFVFKSILVWMTDAEHFFQMASILAALSAVYFSEGNLLSAVLFYAGNVLAGIAKGFIKEIR